MRADLVKRLRDGCNLQQRDGERAADRIEQLERELERTSDVLESQAHVITDLRSQLAAEKALADRAVDRLSRWLGFDDGDGGDAAFMEAYRKARGL